MGQDTHLLDIVTVQESGRPQILSDGPLPRESMSAKNVREKDFPMALLVKGMRARLEMGEASMKADKESILRCVGNGSALKRANATLNAFFARMAWPQAVKRGLVQDFDESAPGTICLPEVLVRDERRKHLTMSLARCEEVGDAEVEELAKGLPPHLTTLKLSFEGCSNVTSAGVHALSKHFPPRLQVLHLDFLECTRITDTGVRCLARNLPASLKEIRLVLANCPGVSHAGIKDLANHLPGHLHHFSGFFCGTMIDRNFNSLSELRGAFGGGGNSWQRLNSISHSRIM